jgi:tRNA (cmo5U34)-methyltransferase
MNNDQLKAIFDQQASGYDTRLTKMAPIHNGLYFLLDSVFAELPADARILCVGVGTGAEVIYLAKRFPGWRFTVVEPSTAMLAVCRQRSEVMEIADRCYFHEGYLDTLPISEMHDAATCFLVSQFILERQARSEFFQQIANRLKPGGILTNADLSADVNADTYEALLRVWLSVMAADNSVEGLNRMKAAYVNDVAVLPPATIATIIQSGGFDAPTSFFQAALIHAWFARRASDTMI